jgi:hypothetical protein
MSESKKKPPWFDDIDGDALPRLIAGGSPVIRVVAGPGSGRRSSATVGDQGPKRRPGRNANGPGLRCAA